jgi:hypothetical protein
MLGMWPHLPVPDMVLSYLRVEKAGVVHGMKAVEVAL